MENSRSGDTLEGPLKRDEEQDKGEKQGVVEGSDSSDPILSPAALFPGDSGGGDGGFGFGVGARPADASVMATLKARGDYWIERFFCKGRICRFLCWTAKSQGEGDAAANRCE